MPEYIDGAKQLSGGKETNWAELAGNLTGWPGLVQDFKLPIKKSAIPVGGMGLNRVANNVAIVAEDISGSIDVHPQNGVLFQFLGKIQTSGAGPYTHTFSPDNNPASFSLADTAVDPTGGASHVTRQVVGCMLTGLQLAYPAKALLKATWNFVAKDATKTTLKQTLTPITMAPYLVAVTALKIDSLEDTNVYDATVNIDTGLSTDEHVFNSLNIVKPGAGQYNPTVTFSRNFVNSDLYDKIIADTEVDLDIVTTRGASDTLTVSLLDCKIVDHDKSSGITGKSKETVTVQAESWQIVIVDSNANYNVL